MRKKLTILGMLFLCISMLNEIYAQENGVLSKVQSKSYDADWVLFQEDEATKVYTKYVDCADPANGLAFEFILLKVENKLNKEVEVSWAWDYTYGNQPRPEEADDEIDVIVQLAAQKTVEATCSPDEYSRLKLFVRDRNTAKAPELTSFKITDYSTK